MFGKVLRQKLITKSYLNLLIDEIVVEDTTIKGSYAALAEMLDKIKAATWNK